MKKKTICFIACISLLMMVLMLPACGGGSEQPIEEKLKVEEGWTIEDDGAYTYAFVFENISDEVLESAEFYPVGYDADGNEMDKGENDRVFMPMGTLYPGEKTVIGEEMSMTRDMGPYFWSETPASFGYEIKNAKWKSDSNKPHIVLENAEEVADNGDASIYSVTLRNVGGEDFDWQKAANDSSGQSQNLIPCVVQKDADGKIKGMATFGANSLSYEYPLIPAGEAVTLEMIAMADSDENNEFLIMWN